MIELDKLLCKLLWGQLRSSGLFAEKKTKIANLKKDSGPRYLYDKWLEASITFLARENYLTYDGEFYSVIVDTTPPDINTMWAEWDQQKGLLLENHDMKARVVLAEATLRALPEILTGKVFATDIMFPNASMELVEGIYKNNTVADYFNEVLADFVIAYIQEQLRQDPSARTRIFEIGAGTGGTSAMIFQKLQSYQAHIQEYCYTDISKAFLLHAQREYGRENPYLTYKIFNVEASIAGQDISPGGYDVVIATNVLHATKNIRQTVRNAKALLRKNGVMLLNELSRSSLFGHLTFGLLAGFWLYEDPQLRIPGCPGLYPDTWQKVLESEGFSSVFFPVQEAHDLGLQIIVAESDGVVRQKQELNPGVTPVLQSVMARRPAISQKATQLSVVQDKQPKRTAIMQIGAAVTNQMVEYHIRETIIDKMSELLKMNKDMIDTDNSFVDYGLDSILGVNLVQAINQALMVELQTIDIFDYSSVNQLARYILSTYKDRIAAALRQNIKPTGVRQDVSFINNSNLRKVNPSSLLQDTDSKRMAVNPADAAMQREPIAIIGMSGRFAKSKNVNELWEHLANGTDLVEKASRWDLSKYYSGKTDYCDYGSFLEDIDQFDPLFFNISGREATYMDPQQRLFLEESWKALEDAGYAGTGLDGHLCGVYVGCAGGDYATLFTDNLPPQAFWGIADSLIPARIAYYLNLQGPAITIDTACSSSLVAIHLACQGLWAGETEMALAGGVFIQCTPDFYLYANRAGMISLTGHCHTFDQQADGFVPGEAVGAIVLKHLHKAIVDGDHIYGVIRGSGINQDGTSNGITAPSAKSQERLERYVYDTFHIHPEEIQMVEAHGTGTKLGDPIEYEALTRAFRKDTDKKEYCAIGSVKTNIGHAVSAAGIGGVIKILLSLQHKKIPPSLHYKSGNFNIQFKDSPFYVNTSLKDWNVEPDFKRCAVVSSFGFSGTNAHIVIEEAPQIERRHSEKAGYLMVVSARTFEQLRRQTEQLVAFCEQEPQVDCGNMSFTLVLGRKHFNHRLACVVSSQNQLVTFLKKWLEKGKISQVYVSELHEKDHQEQSLLKRYGNQCIQNCQNVNDESEYLEHLSAIADLYTKGYGLEYRQLFADEQYSRISLPTYPFNRESYWVSGQENKSSGTKLAPILATTSFLHPLLHQNTSDFTEQRFSSTFTGQEILLTDRVLQGQRVLPWVAHLEMVRAAVSSATGNGEDGQLGIRLKDVVWTKPVTFGDQPVQVHIGLYPEADGDITYAIYSESETDDAEPIVHSQGSALLGPVTGIPILDLPSLQAQCSQNSLTSGQCYEAFRAIGVDYGPGYQGIDTVYVGQGQVLAKLSLPSSVAATQTQYVLHPSMLDSAWQAAIGLMMDTDNLLPFGNRVPLKLILPRALEEIEIFGRCSCVMWALICYSDGCKAGEKVQKLNIDLCDEQGYVCVRLKGVSLQAPEGKAGSEGAAVTFGALMFEPYWQEQTVVQDAITPDYAQHLVILCDQPGHLSRESIEAHLDGVRCLALEFRHNSIEERFQTYVAHAFEEIQNILKEKSLGKVLIQIIVSNQAEQQLSTGLLGLLKTARLENSKLIGQLIEVDTEENTEEIIKKLKEDSHSPSHNHFRYQDGKRWVTGWREVADPPEVKIPWKDRGVYLITGGAGGLGLIFAGEIAHQVKDATLILTGRSPLSEDKKAELRRLAALNARIDYRQVDVTQKKEVANLVQSIQADFGGLNGIIHGAGVIRDNFILKKTRVEMQEVMAPKVTGLVNLDQASKELFLDFFVLFSSGAAVVGNVGQADYSTANAFMDAYAKYRNTLVAAKQRQGRTLAINWPLWKEGGMHVDAATEKMMMQNMGMIAMQTPTGIRALYQGLASGQDQVMVMEGNLARIRQKMFSLTMPDNTKLKKNPVLSSSPAGIDTGRLLEKVQVTLVQAVSKLLKVKLEDINANTELSEYGFDSITLTEFANILNQEYKLELTPTIFFEYSTLHSFAAYLVEEYQTVLAAQFAVQTKTEIFVQARKDQGGGIATGKKRRSRFAKTGVKPDPSVFESIAIVGMSGIFPMARDVDEFWKNLVEGKDCISEIPEDRWNWREYYGDPAKEANKTNIKWGGFIDGIAEFDPLFFGISPREAQFMDPPQRLLMTYVWKAIEDAGYAAQSLSGTKTGIFVGTGISGYSGLFSQAKVAIEGYSSTGMVPSMGPNRMSYFLNIHGPSEPIETACSSSLVALHRAVSAIENGTCEMAIAGGINTILTPEVHISLNKAGMLSEDGRCKTFSSKANGYVRSEGVGMLFLKKLKAAEQAGDHIYGVIRSTAVNHGGRANSLTAPNPKAQTELLKLAYTRASIDPRTVTYIETHGTGTELGDPIEINGVKTAFKELYQATGGPHIVNAHCGLGSVKTNIGHLELAAGIAGVIKVLLQLKHKTLVKSLHSDTINPYIQLQDSPFYIVQEGKEWESLQDEQGNDLPRRAGVSSFGFGGVNAHVVIEEYIPNQEQPQIVTLPQNPAIVVLSAKNEDRLKEQAQQLLTAIGEQQFTDTSLADMAYTLQAGREAMEERLGLIVGSIKELTEKLESFVAGQDGIEDLYRGQIRRNKETFNVFAADEDMVQTIDAWIAKKKYAKLLDLWVKGLIFDWNNLYGDSKPRRISLPTYPFSRERHWIPETKSKTVTAPVLASDDIIHPMLLRNTSNLSIPQHFTQPAGSVYVNMSDKPNGISLPSLSDSKILASKTVTQSQQSVTLSSPNIALSKSGVNTGSIQTAISAEALQVELRANLAEVLSMNQSDVDADTKFIDMGLDSIVGVEWIHSINEQYGTTFTANIVYDYPSMRELSGLLAKELNKQGQLPNSLIKATIRSVVESSPQSVEVLSTGSTTTPDISTIESIATQEQFNSLPSYIAAETLQEELTISLAETLSMNPSDVDVETKVIDMGLDSIIGVEWIHAINDRYGTAFTANIVYDYPSIREFASLLEKELNNHGGGLKQTLTKSSSFPALPELILQVQQGTLDAEQADQLLRQLYAKSSGVNDILLA